MIGPPGVITSPAGRLARMGFTGAEMAAETLGRLGLLGGGLPERPGAAHDDDGELVVSALAASANPTLALATLDRLVAACHHPGDLLSALRFHTGLRQRLVAVIGASAALGEHLVAHPDDWTLLADDGLRACRPSALGVRERLLAAVGGGATARDDSLETLDALRVAYRRQLLLIAACDLVGSIDVEEVAVELADLAAAALDAALAVAVAGLPAGAEPVRLAVIGMGKCGGRELNYRSDVDIVAVAEPLPGGDEAAALETATRLVRGIVRVCGTSTREGDIFPVDLALRPEGKAGPLVRSLASYESYYRGWAHNWELQALLKARPLAGDLGLGREWMQRLAPMVWTTSARPDLPGEVQAMRRRVEATLPAAIADREIKLGRGGLRDIEFAVQLLQLVHGRLDPSLRSAGTLSALETLSAGGYVGRDDAAALAAAYRFLRLVEHRVQLQRLRRTHLVPAHGDPDREWLARACGFRTDALASFDLELRRHADAARRLHEKLFYRPLLSATAKLPVNDARLSPEAAEQRLQALGFSEPRQALAHLTSLTGGVSRRAAIQRTLLPVLLLWFAEEADPDAGLLAFRRLSDSLGETPWFLRSLRDEGETAQRLAHLLARSRYVADLLARAPEAMLLLGDDAALTPREGDRLAEEFLAVVRRTPRAETAVATARGLRRVELLRIASADLLGLIDGTQVQAALSDLAAATIAGALDVAQRKVSTGTRVSVIAMGRLGSRELGYGSDADVIFLHEAGPGQSDADAARVGHGVAEEARRLLALPAPDPPLLLDAGLRPEGREGALTHSLAAFERYHQTRGQIWERQALLRARPLCGDPDLGERFVRLIAPLRYPQAFSVAEEDEVRRLRARVQTQRVAAVLRPGERWRDVKLGPGGLADVEWAVQMLQLRHAARVASLRTTSTTAALAAARDAGLVATVPAEVLLEGLATASWLRDATLLVTGRPGVLPIEAAEPRTSAADRHSGSYIVRMAL